LTIFAYRFVFRARVGPARVPDTRYNVDQVGFRTRWREEKTIQYQKQKKNKI